MAVKGTPGYAQTQNTSSPNFFNNQPPKTKIQDVAFGNYDPSQANSTEPGRNYAASQQTGPYRGGLLTNYRGSNALASDYDTNQGMTNYAAMGDSDSDVRGAAAAQAELDKESHGDTGVSNAEQMALLNKYKANIGMKNSLSEQINGSDDLVKREQDLNKQASGAAIGAGVKNTRQNYNGRGLLFSGMREGGEQGVKATGAAQLATSMAATAREGANAKTAAQNAYASVDLANQQDMLKRSEEAFDTANANSIARRQAMQQVGAGVGSAAGTYVGSQSSAPQGSSYSNPAANYEFNGLQRTGLLAQGSANGQ